MADSVTITISVDNGQLASDLRGIAGAGGDPVPFESLVRLGALYDAIRDEETLEDDASAELYVPDLVELAGLRLYRPSLGALMIVERAASWNVTDRWLAVHTACVLHNAANPVQLAVLSRLDTADPAVADFAPKCRFDEAAWRLALEILMQGTDPSDIDPEAADSTGKKLRMKRTPNGECVCIPGVCAGSSRKVSPEPLDIGCGRFRRVKRWLRGATTCAARLRSRRKSKTSGARTTHGPSAGTRTTHER